jgi:hypothetical protein
MATSGASSVINAISEIIEEDLSGSVPSTIPALDSYYTRLKTSAMGVTSDGIGRDMKVKHPMKQGVAGTVKWVSPLGSAPLGSTTQIVARTAAHVDAYPGLGENVVPGHLTVTIDLARAKGNIFLPIEYLKADKLSATMVSNLREIVVGAAENIVLAEIHQFYAQTATDATGIAQISGSPTIADGNATKDKITFVVKTGSIRNFHPSMLIDFHAISGGARRNTTGPIVVDLVRYLPNTSTDTGGWGQVIGYSMTGENLTAAGVADTDMIVRVDSHGFGPKGPDYWLATTGTKFGVNIATYMQFQSIVAAVSGVATETLFNKYWGRFFDAYGMANIPDAIVSRIGVLNAHAEQNDGLGRFNRSGQRLVMSEGYEFGGVPFNFNGRNVTWDPSSYMPSASDMTASSQTGGILWALKTRDRNLMRYVPPLAGGNVGAEPIPSEVEFVFPQGGPMGIFKPRHDGSGDTVNFLEAPFDRWMAVAPRFMPGIKLTSLTESI